ncbi:glycosyltransferase family 4 protein [Herbinix luporum]|jgi:glycosyltransferase involved in cell wall biosynthesis|uniref:glycosyltransferase family 4 protein n=1 Tax=Herbinix luporum TaxID=1679721 RepID=UPI0023524739|nr:glycosyltransferase family 4 protein [Herbinix luporum]
MSKYNKQRLNIAMLGHKRIPSREGGIEIVVEELSTRMVNKGHKVTCLNRSGHHVSGNEFHIKSTKQFKGVKIKTVPTINKKGLAAMTSSVAASIIAAFGKYDVVHYHAEGPCAMIWIPKLFGKRCIATIHGIDWARTKWQGFAKKYIKFGEKMAVKYADEIIVLSKGVQDYFQNEYNRKTVYIPNGVNKPEIKPADLIAKKYGLQKNSFVLFLARLVPEKGLQYLIEAFKQTETNKKLVIAGGSSDSDDFMKQMKDMAAGDSRIIFTGFVQGQILDELYSNAYIYCLPSDLEGMPLSLLEAMSYGNCCLTSDIAECAEVVEDKAVLFYKGNVASLQEKLEELCRHPEQVEQYKKGAADFICNKYDWDKVVQETLEAYRGESR